MFSLPLSPSIDDVLNNPDLLPEYISSRQHLIQVNDLLLALLFGFTILVVIVCSIAIYIAVNQFCARRYVHRHLHNTYFCGFPLDAIIKQRLWPNLEHYLYLESSEMAAITVMAAFRNNRTARLVGRPNPGYKRRDWHTWVVFRFGGLKYAIDPLTYEDIEVVRWQRPKRRQAKELRIFTSDEFWKIPVCRQLGEKLCSSNTSFLFYEVFTISGNPGGYANFQTFPDDAGWKLIPIWFESTRIVAQNILDDFMANPCYQEPCSAAIMTAIRSEIKYQFPGRVNDARSVDRFTAYLSRPST